MRINLPDAAGWSMHMLKPPTIAEVATQAGVTQPHISGIELGRHRALIARLCDEFSDGWAMSLHSPSLKSILPMCPDDVRVMAWVKPFASFKPGVNPAYAWEPVIVRGGRSRRGRATVRDFCEANIALKKGFRGAKPERFAFWIFEVLGALRTDQVVDLFPGSGAIGRAWERWSEMQRAWILEGGAA